MEPSFSGDLVHKPSRKAILEQVREKPVIYLNLGEEYKSDPEIALAAWLAYGTETLKEHLLSKFLETVVQYVPHFSDHKPVLLRLIELRRSNSIQVYWKCFGLRIVENRDFIQLAAGRVGFADFFGSLPRTVRTDAALLRLAVENVPDDLLSEFIGAVPAEALVEHEFILFHAVERPKVRVRVEQVPSSFWYNRDFVYKCAEKKKEVPIRSLSSYFSSDRELCLSLYRGLSHPMSFMCLGSWISTPLLADKEFVLECLRHHPQAFEFCEKELQNDFDILVGVAVGNIRLGYFGCFVDRLKAAFIPFAKAVHIQIKPHDEFMTLLSCLWKSRNNQIDPLSVWDCDEETTRGLTAMIATYLGTPDHKHLMALQSVWDRILQLVIERGNLSPLLPLFRNQELVHGVLKAIASLNTIRLQSFPEELWNHRLFVIWAATRGMFNRAMPDKFSEDPEICLVYYKHSPAIREQTWSWISDKVKSDRAFLLDCTSTNPLILTQSHTHAFRYDFKLVLNAVYHAAKQSKLNTLVETARAGEWADALIAFAKAVLAKIVAHHGFVCFEAEARARSFFRTRSESTTELLKLIGSFHGAITDSKELGRINSIWSYHAISFLALDGSIDELCKINKFLPEKELRCW